MGQETGRTDEATQPGGNNKEDCEQEKKLQDAAMTKEQHNREDNEETGTGAPRPGKQNRQDAMGESDGPNHRRRRKKNRRDDAGRRNRETPEITGARKCRGGNNRDHATGRTQQRRRRRREKQIRHKKPASKTGVAKRSNEIGRRRNGEMPDREAERRNNRDWETG